MKRLSIAIIAGICSMAGLADAKPWALVGESSTDAGLSRIAIEAAQIGGMGWDDWGLGWRTDAQGNRTYQAKVAGFKSNSDAIAFCEKLKAAGRICVVKDLEAEMADNDPRRPAILAEITRLYELGHKYTYGLGVQADYDRAIHYFDLADQREKQTGVRTLHSRIQDDLGHAWSMKGSMDPNSFSNRLVRGMLTPAPPTWESCRYDPIQQGCP